MPKLEREKTVKVSVTVPRSILEEIDNMYKSRYLNRSYWFLQAAIEKLEKERFEKSKALLEKLEKLEGK